MSCYDACGQADLLVVSSSVTIWSGTNCGHAPRKTSRHSHRFDLLSAYRRGEQRGDW